MYNEDLALTYNGWYTLKPNPTQPNPTQPFECKQMIT